MFNQFLQLTGLVRKWPTLTREEVAKHNTADSLWILIDRSVYDITSVLDHHPGGRGALLRRGGGVKDCAEDLMFHSRATRRETEKYKIGELSPCDVCVPVPASPATSTRQTSSASTLTKVIIASDAEGTLEYGSETAAWESVGQDHPLSSSDSDIHIVGDDSEYHAALVK